MGKIPKRIYFASFQKNSPNLSNDPRTLYQAFCFYDVKHEFLFILFHNNKQFLKNLLFRISSSNYLTSELYIIMCN